jgi:hypothetical protein
MTENHMIRQILLAVGLLAALSLEAQQTNLQTIQIQRVKYRLDSADYAVHHSDRLTLQVDYMSRVAFSGRDYGLKGLGLSPQLTYKHQSGFWVTGVGYYWPGTSQKLPKADWGVGYETALDSRLSASFGYSRWNYFGRSADELRFVFNHFLSTYWTIDLGFMGLSPSFYYMIGNDDNEAQFALTASKYLEWKPIMGGKLIFEPNFTWMTSTRTRYFAARPDVKAGKILRVIDYEVVTPLTYRRVGLFDLTLRAHWTLPVNVQQWDGATEGKSFVFVTAQMKWLLWHKIPSSKPKPHKGFY